MTRDRAATLIYYDGDDCRIGSHIAGKHLTEAQVRDFVVSRGGAAGKVRYIHSWYGPQYKFSTEHREFTI